MQAKLKKEDEEKADLAVELTALHNLCPNYNQIKKVMEINQQKLIQSISLSHTNSAKKKIDYRGKMQSAMEEEKRRNQAMIDEYSKRFKSNNDSRGLSPSRSNNRLPRIQMDRNS